MFPVNNETKLDESLDHCLNKDCNHWEAEEQMASSSSVNWTAQRQADMLLYYLWFTLAQGEAAG